MSEDLVISNVYLVLLAGVFVAAASGLVGSFLALRRMTLLSDALSHVALPGIAIGVLLDFEPLVGGLVFLLLSVVLLWGIEGKTKLAIESITGVMFTTALAVGALLIPEEELLETFFGSVEKTTAIQAAFQIVISLTVIAVTLKYLRKLVLFSIAPDLATAERFSNRKAELLLLALIAVTITVGISFVGILLMSALLIIPAVSARNFATSYKSFLILCVTLAILSLVGGAVLAQIFSVGAGVMTTLVGAFIFLMSLMAKR